MHERLEKFFKEQIALLEDHGHYDPFDESDRRGQQSSFIYSCHHLTQLIGALEKVGRIQENMHLSLSCLKIDSTCLIVTMSLLSLNQ